MPQYLPLPALNAILGSHVMVEEARVFLVYSEGPGEAVS